MSTRSVWLAALLASLAVLAFGVSFQVSMSRHWTRVPLPYGLNAPILVMELAKEPWPTAMLEPGGNRAEMTRQQYIDYGYIPSYTALFILVGILQSWSDRRWVGALGPICVVLALVAATYDLAENRAILGVTELRTASAWAEIRPNALIKWAGAFLVVLLQAPFYLTVSMGSFMGRMLARVLGVAALAAGSIGLYSCIIGYERGIGMATLPLLVATLLMPVFFRLGRRSA